MNVLIPLPIALPLLAAGVSLLLRGHLRLQRTLGIVVLATNTAVALALLLEVDDHGVQSSQMGRWPAPFGITLAVDLFSALLLLISTATLLIVLIYAIGQLDADESSNAYHPIYLVLAAGVSASFLAGDLFYLFVSFEITLAASYVLITLGAGKDQIRSGMTYVAMNLLASMLFLMSVGLIYAATGTVNIADLIDKLPEINDGVRTALGLMLLVAFGVKAAIFPLFNWLPDSYPTAPLTITAVFAGLLTKVGVYAIVRTQTFLFPSDGVSMLLLVVAALTMVVGVLGAIAQDDMKRILSFHIVSQIGYMIMGLALFSVSGIAATIFFVFHQIPVKTSLFLVAGLVERLGGSGSLHRLGGLQRKAPFVGLLFMLAALSLAGIPPFPGFIAKLGLVEAGLTQTEYWIVAVSLVVSLCTLFSMTKIWNGVFWGPVEADTEHAATRNLPKVMLGAATALVVVTLAITVFGRPLNDLTNRAAAGLLDPSEYVHQVLGR